MSYENRTKLEERNITQAGSNSGDVNYDIAEHLRNIEQRLVQIETRQKRLEDKIQRVTQVRRDRFGRQVILTKK